MRRYWLSTELRVPVDQEFPGASANGSAPVL
jgi:hypothetical protein